MKEIVNAIVSPLIFLKAQSLLTLPQVCICIPTYNSALTIQKTLTSVLSQTYENYIIHISDNASTDNTLEIVEAFKSEKIVIHRHHENIGGEGNFNRCIAYANSTYTAIFHADDVYQPDIIERQVTCLEANRTIGAVFTTAQLIDESDNVFGAIRLPADKKQEVVYYEFETLFRDILKHSNFIVCPSAMIKTSILKEVIKGWRGELFKTSADLDVWLRIAQTEKIAVINKPLINYRISKQQHSEKNRKRIVASDIFLVLNYYLSRDEVLHFLSDKDHLHYKRLLRTDLVLRAYNLCLIGMTKEAKSLIENMLCLDAFIAAASCKRAFYTIIALVGIKLYLSLGQPVICKNLLIWMRKIAKK